MLRDVLKKDIPLEDVSRQIKMHLDESSRLQLLHLLFGIAQADAEVHPLEVRAIGDIAGWLGISQQEYESVKAMFYKDTTSAYRILEVEVTATNEEIKKAYRKMAATHHPDKVHHLGSDFRKDAEEKFKSANEAYDRIKKERGII